MQEFLHPQKLCIFTLFGLAKVGVNTGQMATHVEPKRKGVVNGQT